MSEEPKKLLDIAREFSRDPLALALLIESEKPRILVEETTLSGRTLLSLACRHNTPDMIPVLVGSGADIEARARRNRETPLMIACLHGADECARTLLELGADVNAKDVHGWTPLLIACDGVSSRGLSIVPLLLHWGADVNHISLDGWTARSLAEKKGQDSLVYFLKEKETLS